MATRDEREPLPSAATVTGFARVDELAQEPGSSGLFVVHASDGLLETVSRHVERRARALGRRVLRVAGLPFDDAWREVATRLGVDAGVDPVAVAADIAACADGAVVLLHECAPTAWGSVVAEEIARLAEQPRRQGVARGAGLFFVMSSVASGHGDAARISIGSRASRDDVALWWEAAALAEEAPLSARTDRLDAVEAWWLAARSTPPDARLAPADVSPEASTLLARLAASGRSWAVAEAAILGSVAAFEELLSAGVLVVDADGRVSPATVVYVDPAPAPADAAHVARALERVAPRDPWASARASELFALADDPDAAEAAAVRALASVIDPAARGDFWRRWSRTLERLPALSRTPRLLRSVDLALRLGEVDRALDFAREAVASDGDGFDVMLALGRATTARGDLTTAAIALAKALGRAPDAAARARAAVEIAEVRYMAGDLDSAKENAELALAGAADLGTRLLARNVIGKLYLASAKWSEAEQHFAADACEAACGGDVVGELRARLNRAIALISSCRRDEARAMLLSVLADGEKHNELRATSFALANLATIAILSHDYPEALRLSERAIDARRRIGEKIGLSRLITNLAALRVSVGLLEEAEQALAFGRKACGAGMPGARLAHFSLVAARIHFARGRTVEAMAEVAAAIAATSQSSDGGKRGECHRFAARVALEDGDLARVDDELVKAQQDVEAIGARAEIAVLVAMRARAAGDDFGELAEEALALAREADDLELAREALILLRHAATLDGDESSARAHLEQAMALRDRVASGLPEALRERFLARRDLAELGRLEAGALLTPSTPPANDGSATEVLIPPREAKGNARASSAARKLVGEDPAMLALGSAIRKLGPSDATVLVHGESGTGKELVAEAIHAASPRRAGPLVKVNCAALVETLLLSELFGHEKGSFTGASGRRRGRFELAEGGTLFLDEIGDISARTQVALLRVLQERTFERVGGTTPIRANVRIVCATHRDLRGMVARGEFREDLYYRLRGIVLEVPALRQRVGDLPLIVDAILSRVATERSEPAKRLSSRALEGLARHLWPGNVRELENALRAAALFAEGDSIELEDFTDNVEGLRDIELPPAPPLAARSLLGIPATKRTPELEDHGTGYAVTMDPVSCASVSQRAEGVAPGASDPTEIAYAHVRAGTSLGDLKRQIEHDCIARALAESQGNITRAAVLLGMKRPRLSQLVKQYGLGSGSEES